MVCYKICHKKCIVRYIKLSIHESGHKDVQSHILYFVKKLYSLKLRDLRLRIYEDPQPERLKNIF